MKNIQTISKYLLLFTIVLTSLVLTQVEFTNGSVEHFSQKVFIAVFVAFPLGYFWYKMLFGDYGR